MHPQNTPSVVNTAIVRRSRLPRPQSRGVRRARCKALRAQNAIREEKESLAGKESPVESIFIKRSEMGFGSR